MPHFGNIKLKKKNYFQYAQFFNLKFKKKNNQNV